MAEAVRSGNLELLLIQPTPFCNIDCNYCYLGDRSNKSSMSVSTLENVVRSLASSPFISSDFTFCWHAGEPLVVGLEFFQQTIEFIKRYIPDDINVKLNVQTNGILLNDGWCKFFSENSISVGLSLDGPKKNHDSNRHTRSGKGTFEAVVAGLKLLQKHDVSYHVISVLTPLGLDDPVEFYTFFEKLGVTRLGINVEECDGVNADCSFLQRDHDERLKLFFRELLQTWVDYDQSIYIREFDQGIKMIRSLDKSRNVITQDSRPWAIVTVDYLGNYSTFSPELMAMDGARFNFGNVNRDGFDNGAVNKKYIDAAQDVAEGIEKCASTCEYFPVCGGGKPSNKLAENGAISSAETRACTTSTQIIMDELVECITWI